MLLQVLFQMSFFPFFYLIFKQSYLGVIKPKVFCDYLFI